MNLPVNLPPFLFSGFTLNLGGITISPTYWEVGAIIFLLFLLLMMMAQVRRHYIEWSFKGAFFGIFLGFFLALILEGFLLIGGKTALIEVLGWKNPPKPISAALDIGRGKLVDVLGASTQIPNSNANELSTSDSVIQSLQSLSPAEANRAKKIICGK